LEWQKYFLGVGKGGVAGGQRVDTQPACHQLVVHIAGAKIAVAVFRVSLFAGCSTSVAGRSHPLRQENKGVEPHGLSAVRQGGFMYRMFQIFVVISRISQAGPFAILSVGARLSTFSVRVFPRYDRYYCFKFYITDSN